MNLPILNHGLQLALTNKNKFLELFKDPDIKNMQTDLLPAYQTALQKKDEKRMDIYKKKIQDYFLLDKNLVRTNILKNKDNFYLDMQVFIDAEDKALFMKKQMPLKNVMIKKPVFLNDWDGRIPPKIYNKMNEIDEIFKSKEIDYFVADVVNDPDPIFLMQVEGKKEYTFILGAWI